jgi:hypothetical protein
MSVIRSIGAGIGNTFRKRRILFYLWAVNVAFALAVAFPVLALIQKELGHSLLGSGVRVFDITWLGEMVFKYGSALPAIAAGMALPALLFVLFYIFLNGGIIGRLLDREGPVTLAAFLADCGRYAGRFFRLFLISLLFYAVLFGGLLSLLSAGLKPWVESARTEWPLLILSNVRLLIGLLLLSVVHMVFDYARIVAVADEERRAFRALRLALGFLKKRFFRAWGLYLLVVLAILAGAALDLIVSGWIGDASTLALVLSLFWMQVMVVYRVWTKVLFFSAQAEFYRMHPY